MHRRKISAIMAALAIIAAIAVALMPSTVTASTTTTTPHHARHHAAIAASTTNVVVTQTTMVLDAAGARCAASLDAQRCVTLHEQLYPVHPPVGTAAYHTTYGRNEFGQYAVVKTDDPAINVGAMMNGQVRLGGPGRAMPAHTFYKSTGWHHFPCFCNAGTILQSIQVHAFEICLAAQSGCPVQLGQNVSAYAPEYIQQIYGAFAQPFGGVAVYAVANYHDGAETALNGRAQTSYFNAGNGYGRSGFHFIDGTTLGLYGCGAAGGIGWVNYSADQQFTFNGDYTEAGWIDEFPWDCVTYGGHLVNDTHMV